MARHESAPRPVALQLADGTPRPPPGRRTGHRPPPPRHGLLVERRAATRGPRTADEDGARRGRRLEGVAG